MNVTSIFEKNLKAMVCGLDGKGPAQIIINRGGSGSGKTFAILQILLLDALKNKEIITDITSENIPKLKKGVINDMETICKNVGVSFGKCYNKTYRILKLYNNSLIRFPIFKNISDAHGSRRRKLYINEANHMKYPIVEQLLMRTNQTFIDQNPSGESWIDTEFLKKTDLTIKVDYIHSTYLDNKFIPENQRRYIESKRGDGNNNFWRVYGLGELGVADGLVFDNFETIDFDINSFEKYFYGIDWGFSNDPFACIEVAKSGRNLYICREIYQKHLLNNEAIPLVKEIVRNNLVIADSAEPKSITEFQVSGIHCIAADKRKGMLESGIKYLQSFNKIFIHTNCVHTREEFMNYEWQKDKQTDQAVGKPIDAFNHIIDSIRYSLNYEIGNFEEHRQAYKNEEKIRKQLKSNEFFHNLVQKNKDKLETDNELDDLFKIKR